MTTWDEQFAPIMAQGREVREGQRVLGNAIIDAVDKGGNLVAEASTGTGKSFAALIPVITAIQRAKKAKKPYRGVISTETLTLQGQIFGKDLPYLQSVYGDFDYKMLKGRSNYLCLNQADLNAVGNMKINQMVQKLKARKDNLGDGEKKDVDRVLGLELDPEMWSKISSSSEFCADNQCNHDVCFSSLARKRAKEADLVVVNHAVLATDLEMRLNATAEDGLLGDFEALIVDEGHQLEPTLVSQWTKELTVWELNTLSGNVISGVDHAQEAISNFSIGRIAQGALDDLSDVLRSIQNFYSLILEREGTDWKGSSSALSLKYLSGAVSQPLLHAMTEYEEQNPQRIANAEEVLEKTRVYLDKAFAQAVEDQIPAKRRRPIRKGIRAAKDLLEAVRIISKALETRDGIINQYGVYGAIVDGWEKRDGTQGMTIRLVPLDVSPKAQYLWHTRTNVLLSATLTDLTDGSFRYAKECIGFPKSAKEVKVGTPFALDTQQLIYITPAKENPTDAVRGAQFNLTELRNIIGASRGRALILFTSRQELDYVATQLLQLRNMGQFEYPLLIQERDSNKEKLMEQFKSDTSSVLLATKSFFVGIDVPGESLSLVVLAKFPLPRYSVECRQQITHWRSRQFPRWYEREALTILQQAAGRLIRSSDCRGVVGLLDYRVSDAKSNVYKIARIGVDALGSPVTLDMNQVATFLK